MRGYGTARICETGHVLSACIEYDDPASRFCPRCGRPPTSRAPHAEWHCAVLAVEPDHGRLQRQGKPERCSSRTRHLITIHFVTASRVESPLPWMRPLLEAAEQVAGGLPANDAIALRRDLDLIIREARVPRRREEGGRTAQSRTPTGSRRFQAGFLQPSRQRSLGAYVPH